MQVPKTTRAEWDATSDRIIYWTVDGASGCSLAPAIWLDFEVKTLERAGYKVQRIESISLK